MGRRKMAAAIAVMAATAACALSGCDGSAGESEAKEPEVLTIMLNGTASDAYVEGYQRIIDAFNAENAYGVRIEPEFVSNTDYKLKLATMMATETQPDMIYTWELGYLENYVKAGKITELSDYLEEDAGWKERFRRGCLEQETYDGAVYGIPTAQCMAVMYYNKKIFAQYGLEAPSTYEEYCSVCDRLLAATAEDGWLVSQYIQQLGNGIAGYELFEGIKNGTGRWNDPAILEAAELFCTELKKGYFAEGYLDVSGDEAKELFQTGQAAMYFNGSWEIPNLNDPKACPMAEQIGCFVMPAKNSECQNVAVGALDNSFAVTTNCENPEAAVAFLKFWTSEENASMLLYEYGRLPAVSVEVDEGRLSPLSRDVISCFEAQQALTPWFDRVDADLGAKFNEICVEIARGADAKEMLDAVQEYVQSKR